jgi:hypothetical protein
MSAVHIVSTRQEFIDAQWAAKGGDSILLAPGEYQDLFIKNTNFSSEVTISSLDPDNPAIIERLNLSGAQNVTITGLNFERVAPVIAQWPFDHLRIDNTTNIKIHDNAFTGGVVNNGSSEQGFINGTAIFGDNITNLDIADNEFTSVHKAIRVSNSDNVSATGNYIHDYREDGMFFAGIKDLLVEGNRIESPQVFSGLEHADMLQLIGIKDGVIRNNFFNQADGNWTQGILLGKGGYALSAVGNVLIENNIVYSGHHHGISTTDIPDVTIINNTVLFNEHSYVSPPKIVVAGNLSTNVTITGNIADGFWNIYNQGLNKGTIADNIDVQRTDPSLANHVGEFFRDAMADGAATLADLMLLPEKFAELNGVKGIDYDAFPFASGIDPTAPTVVDWSGGIDLSHAPIAAYAPQDAGVFTVSADGSAIDVSGNAWKTVTGPLTLDANAWISFEIEIRHPGEQFGIGLMKDGLVDASAMIQIAGDQIWGNQDFNLALTPESGRVAVSIPVGRFYQGAFDGLVVYADDDKSALGAATFSNIRFGEADAPAQEALRDLAAEANVAWSGPLDLSHAPIAAYAPQDAGVFTVSADGSAIDVSGNAWKTIAAPLTIGDDSWISFTLEVDHGGEQFGIGLLKDGVVTNDNMFIIAGTESWNGRQTYFRGLVPDSDSIEVSIPVGRFIKGAFDGLVVYADDDKSALGAATFSNIRFGEAGGAAPALPAPLPAPPAPTPAPPPADMATLPMFSAGAIKAFEAGQQDFGSATVIEDGAGISVTGNGWKYVAQDVAIASDTILSFDFRAPVAGELHGIGFETDNVSDAGHFFRLSGSQVWGNGDFVQKGAIGDWVHVEIPVGQYLSGDIDRLVFVADDDAKAKGVSEFRNIEWTTAGAADTIVFTSDQTKSFDPANQDRGTAKVIEGGDGISVTGNGWKYVAQDVVIADDTVLSFDFRAPVTGELHGISFETDNLLGENGKGFDERLFKLSGTQVWGNSDFVQTGAAGDWVHVEIPVGQYLSGDIDRLVFVADDDATGKGVSEFRNIEWTTLSSDALL